MESSIRLSDKLNLLKSILEHGESENILPVVSVFDFKAQYKILYQATGVALENIVPRDPKVADWLLRPSEKEKSVFSLVSLFYFFIIYIHGIVKSFVD